MGIKSFLSRQWIACSLIVMSLCLAQSSARADTRVDWQRGLLIGTGASAGDLRSPNRQLARVKSERQARERCREQILSAAEHVASAKGRATFRDRARLERFISDLMTLSTDFGSDGSVVVEMALPLDTLRAFAYGADLPTSGADGKTTVLLIDARKLKVKPAVGYQLGDGTDTYRGPTLFFTDVKQARLHRDIEVSTKLVLATKTSKGVLQVPRGTLALTASGRPLVAILWSENK